MTTSQQFLQSFWLYMIHNWGERNADQYGRSAGKPRQIYHIGGEGRYFYYADHIFSTASHDRGAKKGVYEQHGVKEYWITDPKSKIVEVYHLKEGRFVFGNVYAAYEEWEWKSRSDKEKEAAKLPLKVSLYDDFFIDVREISSTCSRTRDRGAGKWIRKADRDKQKCSWSFASRAFCLPQIRAIIADGEGTDAARAPREDNR